jgi:hypothetical protein
MFSCKERIQFGTNAFQSAVSDVAYLVTSKFSIILRWLLSGIKSRRVVRG